MLQHVVRRVVAFVPRPAVACALRGMIPLLLAACRAGDTPPARSDAAVPLASPAAIAARDSWVAGIDTLRLRVLQLDSATTRLASDPTPTSAASAQVHFRDARLAFKRIEFLAAYYEPSTTRAMNGPALPRVDDEEGPEAVFPPEGFQVIEELLFPEPGSLDRQQVVNETRNLLAYVTRLRTTAAGQVITDDRLWDAAKIEVARIVTLGITGFDSPIALLSLRESAAALDGMRVALRGYRGAMGAPSWTALDAAFLSAMSMLHDAESFNRFDRLVFITAAANPLAQVLGRSRTQLGIGIPEERRGWRAEAVTLFDANAFDAHAFASPHTGRATSDRVALGRALFFETALSDDGTVTCASCHDPAIAFTDGRVRSASRSGTRSLRNAPTIINAGLQVGSFYDLRTTYLEDQISDVVRNPEEMHGSIDAAAVRLSRDSSYRRRFANAFPDDRDSAMQGRNIRFAIAAYIRSLQALNSRVDRALRGETAVLSVVERQGMNLFMGKAKCGTCHFAPLFNGTVPPSYQESEVEVLGVPATAVVRRARVDPDSGRFAVTRSAPHLHAFKTPSVRNVALTAPYMHNGVYRTLDAVVDFYNRGGGAGIGIQLENQTLPPEPLQLTARERRALVRFMEALTDTVPQVMTPEVEAYRARMTGQVAARR